MVSAESVKYELVGRLGDLSDQTGKTHISVRWEPRGRMVRIGACLQEYNWDSRMSVLHKILAFEADHADEFDIEFDIVPLDAVKDEDFAEA